MGAPDNFTEYWYELARDAMYLAEGPLQRKILEAYQSGDHTELGRLMALLWDRHCTMANLSTLRRAHG